MVSRESKEYISKLYESPAFGASGFFDLDGLRQGMATRREPNDKTIQCIHIMIDDIPCEWVLAEGSDPDLRMLYLHGGGYVSGSGAFYLTMAGHISVATKCAVLLPDYRLAPEHQFPTAIEDCIRAHEWLRSIGPTGSAPAKATFIAGDSAGGGLTLATLLALRDRQLPLPKAGITLSAFADLTLTGESIISQEKFDPIMSPKCLPEFVKLYLGDSDPRNPLASPVFGNYIGIPPLLIQVGEYEIIRDDSIQVAAKASADGVDVTLEVWDGMIHVFQSHEPLLSEGREAIEHIANFMRKHLA
jgi:epsilon-lactone hydrolase